MKARPLAFEDPGRFEISCYHLPASLYPEETHTAVQVCIPFEGARYDVTRQSEVGAKQFQRLNARDVLVVPIGQPHAVDWLQGADILSIQMSESFITEALDIPTLTLRDSITLRDPLISVVASEMREALQQSETPSPALLEAFTTIIAYRIGKEALNGSAVRAHREAPLSADQMDRIRRHIAEQIDKHIKIAELADLLGLSMWHFVRRFAATEGMSPHAYLTQLRFRHAQSLLSETETSIVEIAMEVGMTHSHFSRTFLAHLGVSPTEYRRRSRNQQADTR